MLAALVAVLLSTGPASAHLLTIDSVDANEQINYRNYTKYDGVVSHATYWWNELDTRYSYTGVRIFPDNSNTAVDLDVGDYTDCNTATTGRWMPRTGPDLIQFNTCKLDYFDAFNQKSVGTHEFGHALRLAHADRTEYYRENSIMYPCSTCTNYNTPRPHDDSDYYHQWIN